MHHLPRLGIVQHHADTARDILPEVRHQISGAVPEKPAGELLLLPNGDTLVGDQCCIGMLCFQNGRHPIACRDSGVIGFALLQIGLLDRAGSRFKGFIRGDGLAAPVCIGEHQLTPQCQPVAEIVVPAPPAVTHGSLPQVFTLMEQSRHIISLHLNPVVITGQAGGKLVIRYRFAVQLRFVHAVGRDT